MATSFLIAISRFSGASSAFVSRSVRMRKRVRPLTLPMDRVLRIAAGIALGLVLVG